MANILACLGIRFFGGLPKRRKRERKKKQVDTRDYWSGTTTTLETDDAFAAAGSPMEAMLSDEKEESVDEKAQAQVRTTEDDAAVMMEQDTPGETVDYNKPVEANRAESVDAVSDEAASAETASVFSMGDPLLGQIEQFRQQAANLQKLMQDKETRAKELESLVEQREDRAEELQQLVAEREDKVDKLDEIVAQREEIAKGVTEEVVKRLDGIYNRMEIRLDQVEENVRGDILDGVRVDTAHSQQLSDTVTSQGRQLESLQQSVDGVAGDAKEIYAALEGAAASAAKTVDNTDGIRVDIEDLSGRVSAIADGGNSIRTTVEGISGDVSELKDNVDCVNAGVISMNATVAEMNEAVDGMTGTVKGISENVEGLPDVFYHMITESIHSECVMNFRNTADLMKDMEDRLDKLETLKKETKGTRRFAICAMIFAILTFLAASGSALVTLISML